MLTLRLPPPSPTPSAPQARQELAMITWTSDPPFSDLLLILQLAKPQGQAEYLEAVSPSGQLCQNSREGSRIPGDKQESHPLRDVFCFSSLVSCIYLYILSPD